MSDKEDVQKSVEVYKSSFFLLKEVIVFFFLMCSTLSGILIWNTMGIAFCDF